jgi:putative transcriptional regulator
MPDPRFAQTVIYIVSHNAQGAFGLVINRPIGAGPMREFLMGFGLEGSGNAGDVLLHYGGPVEPARLFVLHSSDWTSPTTMTVHGGIAVTAHPEVLEAIAEGRGPRHSLVILGYAGWGSQQLDQELAREDWITAPADPALVFDEDAESKWERASEIGGLAL